MLTLYYDYACNQILNSCLAEKSIDSKVKK
jgi:hypothetical protein